MTTYIYSFSTRATIKIHIKIRGIKESILELIDHSFEINILFKKVYEKKKWPIDTNQRWTLRIINNKRKNLYEALLTIDIKIGDVEVEKIFFVQNQGSYSIILEKLYIIAIRMEIKMLDDGLNYARMRSHDDKKSV